MKHLVCSLILVLTLIGCNQPDQVLNLDDVDAGWNKIGTISEKGTFEGVLQPGQNTSLDQGLLANANVYGATKKLPIKYTKIEYTKVYLHSTQDVLVYRVTADDGFSTSMGILLRRDDQSLYIDLNDTETARAQKIKKSGSTKSSNGLFAPPKCVAQNSCPGPCTLSGGPADGYWDCVCTGNGSCVLLTDTQVN